MGTSANINVKVDDKYHCTRVNYDGYLEGVGKTLHEFYNSQELAERLVSFGELSSLDSSCEQPPGHAYDTPVRGYSVYYGRDRGETGTEFTVTDEPVDSEGYCYVWDGSEWTVTCVEYDGKKYKGTSLSIVFGLEEDLVDDTDDKMLKYFGCDIDQVIAINNEWSVTFNTPDDRMTDAYNERIRWMVRHREAPYQGLDEDGIWHHSFFGRTLLEAVLRGEEYLARGQEFEAGRYGD